MSPVYRLAGIHVGLLVLSIPLIMLWYVYEVEAGPDDISGKWAYITIAAIYAVISVTGKPKSFYKVLGCAITSKKAVRILVGCAALFTGSAAFDNTGGTSTALGIISLISALTLFLWTVAIALFGGTSDSELA